MDCGPLLHSTIAAAGRHETISSISMVAISEPKHFATIWKKIITALAARRRESPQCPYTYWQINSPVFLSLFLSHSLCGHLSLQSVQLTVFRVQALKLPLTKVMIRLYSLGPIRGPLNKQDTCWAAAFFAFNVFYSCSSDGNSPTLLAASRVPPFPQICQKLLAVFFLHSQRTHGRIYNNYIKSVNCCLVQCAITR